MSQGLPPCCVAVGRHQRMGFLYMQNDRVVVLLNDLVERTDLGPLQSIRHHHIEPEADIWICPRAQVDAVDILKAVE